MSRLRAIINWVKLFFKKKTYTVVPSDEDKKIEVKKPSLLREGDRGLL